MGDNPDAAEKLELLRVDLEDEQRRRADMESENRSVCWEGGRSISHWENRTVDLHIFKVSTLKRQFFLLTSMFVKLSTLKTIINLVELIKRLVLENQPICFTAGPL